MAYALGTYAFAQSRNDSECIECEDALSKLSDAAKSFIDLAMKTDSLEEVSMLLYSSSGKKYQCGIKRLQEIELTNSTDK